MASVALANSDAKAYGPALAAISAADLVVLGPGSLFTSILAALLVPGIAAAIDASKAKVVYVAPLTDSQGETWGLSASELVGKLLEQSGLSRLDFVLFNSGASALRPGSATASFLAIGDKGELPVIDPELECRHLPKTHKGQVSTGKHGASALKPRQHPLALSDVDRAAIQRRGSQLMVRQLEDPDRPGHHSIGALKESLQEVMRTCPSQQR